MENYSNSELKKDLMEKTKTKRERSPVGGRDLWNRYHLVLEWKREEVMDGVMVVTDDERG